MNSIINNLKINIEYRVLHFQQSYIPLQQNFVFLDILCTSVVPITLYPTLGSCGVCTPFSVPLQWNTGIEYILSLPAGALQSLEIQAKRGD